MQLVNSFKCEVRRSMKNTNTEILRFSPQGRGSIKSLKYCRVQGGGGLNRIRVGGGGGGGGGGAKQRGGAK